MVDQDEPRWDTKTDDWYEQVCKEMKLKGAADLMTLQVAATAIHHVSTSTPTPDDLRLILDALTALRMRRRHWFG